MRQLNSPLFRILGVALIAALLASACSSGVASDSPSALTFTGDRAPEISDANIGAALREPTGCPAQVPADPSLVEPSALSRLDADGCLMIEAVDSAVPTSDAEATEGFLALSTPTNFTIDALPSDVPKALSWGHDAMRVVPTRTTANGEGVLVAIVDTGIDLDHPQLAASVTTGFDLIGGTTLGDDDHGHGTSLAGIIAANGSPSNAKGIAPAAELMPIKVLGADGTGTSLAVAQGIVTAVDQGADVVLLALGSYDGSEEVELALQYGFDHGVVVVASTGNDGQRRRRFPASVDGVIATSALDSPTTIASFSNIGEHIAFAAPGSGIGSTAIGGGTTVEAGTSVAAAFVAGSVAAVMSKEKLASLSTLFNTAHDLGPTGHDESFGLGLIDLADALDVVVPQADPGNSIAADLIDTTSTTVVPEETTTTTSTTSTAPRATTTTTAAPRVTTTVRPTTTTTTSTTTTTTTTTTTSTTTTTTSTTTIPPAAPENDCWKPETMQIDETPDKLYFEFEWNDCGFESFEWKRGYVFFTNDGVEVSSYNAGTGFTTDASKVMWIIDPEDAFDEQNICLRVRPKKPGSQPSGLWSEWVCATGSV